MNPLRRVLRTAATGIAPLVLLSLAVSCTDNGASSGNGEAEPFDPPTTIPEKQPIESTIEEEVPEEVVVENEALHKARTELLELARAELESTASMIPKIEKEIEQALDGQTKVWQDVLEEVRKEREALEQAIEDLQEADLDEVKPQDRGEVERYFQTAREALQKLETTREGVPEFAAESGDSTGG